MATAIMGLAVVAMLVGSSVTFTSSGANRQSTTAGILARDYAEDLALAVPSGGAWCSYPTAYVVPLTFTMPSGYTVKNVPGTCPAADTTTPQYQTVTITVTAPNRAIETLIDIVREP